MYKEIYLMLTEACPNRCEYCYIKNRRQSKSMSFEMVEEIIKKHNPNRIIFFGGEPLLELGLMERILKKYIDKIKFQVVTSTSVNFKEFKELNKKYPLDEIQISWDGFNDNRIDSSGNSIHIKVYSNIMNAIKDGLKFDIKCVISNDNVDQMSIIHNKFLYLKRFDVSGQFVIAHRHYYSDGFYSKLENELPKTFTLDKLYSDHLNKIIAYLQRDKNFSSCDIGKYIVITPDGKESFCTALSQDETIFNNQSIQQRCKHSDCINCEYSFLCDGGCRYERYEKFKDEWEYNYLESTCKVTKIYYKTIHNFIESLSPLDKKFLINEIFRYKKYLNNYYGGV